MKRLLSLALTVTLLLALFACGKPAAAVPNPALVLAEKYLFDMAYEQALLQFDQAIVIEPKNPRGYLGKYAALEFMDRHDEAVQILQETKKKVVMAQRGQISAILAAAMASAIDGLATATEAYNGFGFRDVALKLLELCVEVYDGVERFVLLRDVLVEEIGTEQYVLCPHGEDEHGVVYHLVLNTQEANAEVQTMPEAPTITAMITTTIQTSADGNVIGRWLGGTGGIGQEFVLAEFTHNNKIIFVQGIDSTDVGIDCEGTYHTDGNKLFIDLHYVEEPEEWNSFTRRELDLTGILEYDVQGNRMNLRWIEGQELKNWFMLDSNLQSTLSLDS